MADGGELYGQTKTCDKSPDVVELTTTAVPSKYELDKVFGTESDRWSTPITSEVPGSAALLKEGHDIVVRMLDFQGSPDECLQLELDAEEWVTKARKSL